MAANKPKPILTTLSLNPDLHRVAQDRAVELGLSLADYVTRLVRRDLEQPLAARASIDVIFGLGHSAGSDVATSKDLYVGEAVEALRTRSD